MVSVTTQTHTHTHTHADKGAHIYQNVFKSKLCKMFEVPKTVFQQRLKSVAVIPGPHNPTAPPSAKQILFNALSAHGACVTRTKKKEKKRSKCKK